MASQLHLSDAAMEATLNGRAEYARILADLGFVSSAYAARCNSPDITEGADGQDAMSSNARVIKAAICAGKNATTEQADCGVLPSSRRTWMAQILGCRGYQNVVLRQSYCSVQASIPASSGLSTLPESIRKS